MAAGDPGGECAGMTAKVHRASFWGDQAVLDLMVVMDAIQT